MLTAKATVPCSSRIGMAVTARQDSSPVSTLRTRRTSSSGSSPRSARRPGRDSTGTASPSSVTNSNRARIRLGSVLVTTGLDAYPRRAAPAAFAYTRLPARSWMVIPTGRTSSTGPASNGTGRAFSLISPGTRSSLTARAYAGGAQGCPGLFGFDAKVLQALHTRDLEQAPDPFAGAQQNHAVLRTQGLGQLDHRPEAGAVHEPQLGHVEIQVGPFLGQGAQAGGVLQGGLPGQPVPVFCPEKRPG